MIWLMIKSGIVLLLTIKALKYSSMKEYLYICINKFEHGRIFCSIGAIQFLEWKYF